MIIYDTGESHLWFIWRLKGSLIPKAALFSAPSAAFAVGWHYIFKYYAEQLAFMSNVNHGTTWSVIVVVLGMLLGFRTSKAYGRFWEGITLVQQMSAEWFEACSNLMAFSNVVLHQQRGDAEQQRVKQNVQDFQHRLVRLMSLMHGTALRQIGGYSEEFIVLDAEALDDESMEYLYRFCPQNHVNPVEVLLHWTQVLITDSISSGVLVVPPPILTRAYQTLSRGMVNLNNARKLADVPFPFPLSQMVVVLLLMQCILTPLLVAAIVPNGLLAAIVTFLPLCGMWSVTFIAGQLEQPFGQDSNDLPLAALQHSLNTSLLMLLDYRAERAPSLKEEALLSAGLLRKQLKRGSCRTDSLKAEFVGTVPSMKGVWERNDLKHWPSQGSSLAFGASGSWSRRVSGASQLSPIADDGEDPGAELTDLTAADGQAGQETSGQEAARDAGRMDGGGATCSLDVHPCIAADAGTGVVKDAGHRCPALPAPPQTTLTPAPPDDQESTRGLRRTEFRSAPLLHARQGELSMSRSACAGSGEGVRGGPVSAVAPTFFDGTARTNSESSFDGGGCDASPLQPPPVVPEPQREHYEIIERGPSPSMNMSCQWSSAMQRTCASERL